MTCRRHWLAAFLFVAAVVPALSGEPAGGWAEIRVVDAATERGVPLVELETVNGLRFVTDNAGRVAFAEPGLLDREVFFTVRSHGYEVKKDGFGFAGVRVTPTVGKVAEVRVTRRNLAERLCRLTGEGLYRDSVLLGHKVPPINPGLVAGQDSVQAAVYGGKVYWFWGDTQQMKYPLGLFRMAGATTALFDAMSDPAGGIAFDYFADKTGFARAMMPLADRPQGVVWVSAVFTVPDEAGKEKLVGHYSRRKGLGEEYEHGIAVFDDEKAVFESVKQLPLKETWCRPSGHPIVHTEAGKTWLLFGSPTPNVRVPATLQDVLDPAKYEAFTCAKANGEPDIGKDEQPAWRWQKELSPVDSRTENGWVKAGKLKPEHARFCPADVATPADRVVLHSGTVRWNPFRKAWVLIACQFGGKSFLGEVWYAEAAQPTGPFHHAAKVVTHDRQSFYNVCHHTFLDRDDGRVIHFEGTYTNDFSGNPDKTPRYNYNQVLYRLDLENTPLAAVRTLAGHTGSVMAVVFSPDGKTLASSSRDKSIRLWDPRTGKLDRTLTEHDADVYAVVYSPKGDLMASASGDKTVKLWDARTGKVLRTLTGHTDIVRSVAFSPDGKALASVSVDKTVRLWDVATGEAIQTLSGHTARVKSVAYSPDGATLATVASDRTVRLWDVKATKARAVLEGHTGDLETVAYAPDGKSLASSSGDGTVRIWDAENGKLLHTLEGHHGEVDSVAFAPDGKTLASGSKDTTIKLWDARTGKLLRTLTGHTGRVESLTFAPDGKTLATGGGGGDTAVKLWDLTRE